MPLPQVHQKRIAMAAAVGEPEGYPELDDGMSTVSTAVTGLSAYTLRTHNPTASSASQGATSTVGGRGPGQHKVPVNYSMACLGNVDSGPSVACA